MIISNNIYLVPTLPNGYTPMELVFESVDNPIEPWDLIILNKPRRTVILSMWNSFGSCTQFIGPWYSLEFLDKFCSRCFGSITSIGLGVEKKIDGINAVC